MALDAAGIPIVDVRNERAAVHTVPAFGSHAERVERAADLPGALARVMVNRPDLLDELVTTEAVSSGARSGPAWVWRRGIP